MITTNRFPRLSNAIGLIVLALCLAIVMPASVGATACPDSTTHYWKFNEVSGPPYGDAIAGNDATCANCPAPVLGVIAAGQHFDGANDEVDAPNDGSLDWGKDDSFSILYWLRTTASTSGNRVLVGRDDAVNSLHWWTGANNVGRVAFQLRDRNGNGAFIGDKGSMLNDGLWHFIVAVRDNDSDMNRIYVDGVKVDSVFHDYTAGFDGTADLNIGYLNLSGHYRFEGTIDEVATINRALMDNEIMTFYNDGLAGIGYCGADTVPPTILSSPPTTGRIAELYTYDVDAVGAPAPTYQMVTGPPSMTINSTTGEIQWMPAAAGTVPVTVRALNLGGTNDQSYTVDVSQPPTCPSDMVSYWRLDESSGTSYDDYYGSNDGEASVSAPTPVAGLVNGAQEFNGTSDRITVADDPSLDWAADQSVTIELWAKFTNVASQNKVMIGRDGGGGGKPHWWVGAEQNTGNVLFVLRDTNGNGTSISSSTAVNDGQWHHIIAVKDESVDRIRVYVDAVKEDSAYHDFTAGFGTTTAMGIGFMAYAGTPNYYYGGALDEIALYDRALSDIEVNQHYVNGLAALGYCSEGATAPTIVSTPVTSAEVGEPYTYDVDAAGIPGPQYALVTSPAGMTVDGITGVISWTPPGAGDYGVVVTAFNTAGIDSQGFDIDVPATPAITSTPVTEATVGAPYTYDVDATGFPAPMYSLLMKPSGMTIDPVNGVIDWTPATAGTFGVMVTAHNSAGADTQSYDVDVKDLSLCPSLMTHYWKLDETSGPPYEDYFSGNDASCSGCPVPVAGIVNGAQSFDGVNDEVDAPNDGSWDWGKDDSFSIVYWMKTSASTAGNRVIVARDDAASSLHWWVGCDNSGRVRFQLRDINGNGAYIGDKGAVLNDGVWHFIVAVRDNSADMNRIYVDGAKVDSASHDYTAGFSGTANLNVGYLNLGGHYRFEGIVDEVATFDKALSEAEISAHYNNGMSGNDYCSFAPFAPTITSMPVVDAVVGQLYTYDVDATGLPAPTYSLSVYPAGMTIDSNNGLVEWTPAAAGSALVTVEANNSVGSDDQTYTITVTEPPACPDGMISYWKLDELSGTTYDDYFGGNVGHAPVSAPTPTVGIVVGAMDFNGTSDRITVADDPSLDWAGDQSFTIELWAKFTNVSTRNKVMIGRDDGGGGHPHWWLGAVQSTGVANFNLLDTNANGVALTGTTALNDDQWHHLVAVRDNSVDMNRLYVDGVKVDSANHDYTAGFEATTTLGIGYMAYAGNPDYYYDGALDEIALYGRALTDAEIQQHYGDGLVGVDYCTGSPVPTLLQNFTARVRESQIVVKWRLYEAGSPLRFAVLRAEGTNGRFVEIANPRIERSNLSFTFKDADLKPGTTYRYRVQVTDEDGTRILFETESVAAPAAELALLQNRPNPFNPSTNIQFVLPEKGYASLSIFDVRGKLVVRLVDGVLGDGVKTVTWDGKDATGAAMSSGVYFYRLEAGNRVLTKKMVLIK